MTLARFDFNAAEVMYYVWSTLLVLACAAAWVATIFTLPGNWCMVVLCALFAFLLPVEDGRGLSWTVVGLVGGLAALGELIEFAAGAAGAAKKGGSRRAMILSIGGAAVGSIVGALIGIPIPLVGPIIAAIGGGALGAFVGAYLGETWKGTGHEERVEISNAALVGRLLGTFGKLAVGAIMVVVVAVGVFA